MAKEGVAVVLFAQGPQTLCCDADMGEENQGEEKVSFSTPPPALDNFKDTVKVVQNKRGESDERNSAPAQKAERGTISATPSQCITTQAEEAKKDNEQVLCDISKVQKKVQKKNTRGHVQRTRQKEMQSREEDLST
eukprot:13472146-Ditylum_brightwellii.AAC.1